jgi:hypothetical protein
MGFCAHTGKYLWVRISCTNIVYCPDFVYIYRKFISGQVVLSSHLLRTKAAPSSLHACLTHAPSLQKVRSRSSSGSRSTCGKYAGLPYTERAAFGVVVPALKRRKSEQGAKEKRRRCEAGQQIDLQNPSFRTTAFYSFFSASFKSALMSSTFSIPSDRRSILGYTPEAILASSGSCSCVVLAG